MIIQTIDGITEFDAFGKPIKYFLEYPEIYNGNEEVIGKLRKKVMAEYERDKQEADRERVREEAQYLEDLETIKSKNSDSFKDEDKAVSPERAEFVTSEQLQQYAKVIYYISHEQILQFWNALPQRRSQVVKIIFKRCGINICDHFKSSLENNGVSKLAVPPIPRTASHTDRSIYWLILQYEYSMRLISNEENQAEMETALNDIETTLITFADKEQQLRFLVKFLSILTETNYNPLHANMIRAISSYIFQLSQIQESHGFCLQNPPIIVLAQSRTTMPQTSNRQVQHKPSVIVEKASRAAFVAVFDSMKKQGIIDGDGMSDSAVAKLIGAKRKGDISAARNQKISLSNKLYKFVLALLEKASLKELQQLEKDVKKIIKDKFSEDEPLK